MAIGIYINCRRAQFVEWILSRAKPYETRARDMLGQLVGQRVFLIETGHGEPRVKGAATITRAQKIPYSDTVMRARAKINGTPYDIQPGGAKWFYELSDVERFQDPFPVPAARENHGRSWTAW